MPRNPPHGLPENLLNSSPVLTVEKRVQERTSAGERERESARVDSSFYRFFPPLGSALCKLGQAAVLFVLPEVLTPVLGPSSILFSRAFPFLVF